MYIISNNSFKFKEILNKFNLFFSENVLNKFLSSKLKIQSDMLYNSLCLKGININSINIMDRKFYTCTYGNIEVLNINLKKQYIYYNENMSKCGKLKYRYFLNNKNIKENINVCLDYENIRKDSQNIVIINLSNISELRSIDVKLLNKDNLYIFNLFDANLMLCLCDVLFLIEARYERNIVKLVDNLLNFGKEILVLPGDVWNKNCYFSNFLIREGAGVILNINDLNMYL